MTPPRQPDPSPGRSNTPIIVAIVVATVAIGAGIAAGAVFIVRSGSAHDMSTTTSSRTTTVGSTTARSTTQAPVANGQLPSFTPAPDLGADCQYQSSGEPASRQVDPPSEGDIGTDPAEVSARIVTDQGAIGLILDNAKSPCTVNSFTSLAGQGFFDGTGCHRLTTSPTLAVLQCGDPAGDGTGGPGYEFADEYPTDQYPPGDPALRRPVIYPRGTLAMANAGPNTNGSQFFLVYKDSQLPPNYTVFGTIQPDGLTTLDKIAAGGVQPGGRAPDDGPPTTTVTITSVRVG